MCTSRQLFLWLLGAFNQGMAWESVGFIRSRRPARFALVMKDRSMVSYFQEGDLVQVSCDDVRRQGSALAGFCGVVTDAWVKCEVDPHCCCAEQVEDSHAVTVGFKFAQFTQGYSYLFAEAELRKLQETLALPDRTRAAESVLSDFDVRHRAAARNGFNGLTGGAAANAFACSLSLPERQKLRAALQAVLTGGCNRLALGICAPTATEGYSVLQRWATALDLPRGVVHGMDKEGVPIEVPGAVYIKYNSGTKTFADVRANGGIAWKPGDAFLSGYDGDYRGVGVVPHRPDDDAPNQYAYLPLDLF